MARSAQRATRAVVLVVCCGLGISAWAQPAASRADRLQQARALLAGLDSPDAEQRRAVLEGLLELTDEVVRAGAVGRLVELVRSDPDLGVRELSLQLLGGIGPPAAELGLPLVLELIEHDQPGRLRGWAAFALGKLKPPIALVAKRLIPLLLLPDDFLRAAVEGALLELDDAVLPLMVFLIGQAPEAYTRRRLAEAVARFGPRARSLVPELLRLRTADSNPGVRDCLLEAVLRILPKDDPQVLQLTLAEFERARGHRRSALIGALGKLGPAAAAALPALRKALDDSDKDVRSAALGSIAAIVTPQTAGDLPGAVAPLLDGDWLTGVKAADALLRMGPAGLRRLVEASGHPAERVRRFAWEALAKQPPWTAGQLEALAVRFDAEDSAAVRQVIAAAMGALGPAAVPHLFAALAREPQAAVRSGLVHALSGCGPDALDGLMRALADGDPQVRQAAAAGLGELGAVAEPAVEPLLAAETGGLMSDGLGALSKIGAAAIEPLRQGLRQPEARIRERAAYGFGLVGPPAAPAARELCAALSDPVEQVRQWAAWSIGKLGPGADYAIEDLQAALTDPSDDVRQNAARSLGQLGPVALLALPDLVGLLADPRLFVAENAAEAIGGFGPAAAAAVPDLIGCLSHHADESARRAAATALGKLAVRTGPVLAALRKALDDPKARVRWAAAQALESIGDPSDRIRTGRILRTAPEEAWREDAEAIGKLNRSLGR